MKRYELLNFVFPKNSLRNMLKLTKKMKPEDLVYGRHNCNRYRMVISFISNFLTEVTDTDEMYKMLNEFNNKINELKIDYLAGQCEEIDDVTENVSLMYNNQLKCFDDFIMKNKQSTAKKQISKSGSSSSSPTTIRFLSQETIGKTLDK